jgi:hypothetical protein
VGVLAAVALGACGDRIVESMDGTGTSAGDGMSPMDSGATTSAEPTTASEPKPGPESESETDPNPEEDTEDDTGTVVGDCHPIEAIEIEHVAFSGTWCFGPPDESAVLTTQAEVDAHTAMFCESCWPPEQPCPKSPKLKKDTAIIFAYAVMPMGAIHLKILSVEDCGGAVVVGGEAQMSCETAFSSAWSSVIVPAFEKPAIFDIEQLPGECDSVKCPDDGRLCLQESDCPGDRTCVTGCCAFP